MASRLSQILDQLAVHLALPDGLGTPYTHDLSGTDQVLVGASAWPPPVYPFVMVPEMSEGLGEPGPGFPKDLLTYDFTVLGYVQATTASAFARGKAAADLLSDLRVALLAASGSAPIRHLGLSFVTQVRVTSAIAWGTADGVTPSHGVVDMTCSVSFATDDTGAS